MFAYTGAVSAPPAGALVKGFHRMDECPYFEGTFIAKDTDGEEFVKRLCD